MTTAPAASGSSKKLIIGLAVGGGVLLLVVVALGFLLLGRGMASPAAIETPSPSDTSTSPSATPSETPNAEPADDAPPPADNTVRFTSFNAPTTTVCDAGDEDNQPPKPRIQVSWVGANAATAFYMPSSSEDFSNGNGYEIPTSGNQDQILIGDEPSLFPCFHDTEQDYTIVLVGSDGTRVAKHWNVRNVGDQ